MLGKWFKRKSVPSNDGKTGSHDLGRLEYRKVFELELSNMEGSPSYPLTHQLSIGSEIGNVIISDPSISPRHATFILQQEVVSVIDHGSINGTKVNGKNIPSGRYIILEESDVVQVGDLEVKIHTANEAVPVEDIPEPPAEDEEIEDVEEAVELLDDEDDDEEIVEESEDEDIEEDEDEDEDEEKEPTSKFDPRNFLKSNKKAGKKKRQETLYATNSLVRVIAVLSDFFIAYSLLVILMPFDDVRDFFGFLHTQLDFDWKGMWDALKGDLGYAGTLAEEILAFFQAYFHAGPLFLMFVLVRILSTFLMGVSFSEFMLGVKSAGNGIWKRVAGVVRVLVGVITGPFLIFDIPAIISRRTLKEFLTFTRTYVTSKFVTILGVTLFVPLMIVFAIMSPLMQGFEPPEPILVSDKIDRRIKATDAAVVEDVNPVKDKGSYFGLELDYNANEVSIFPDFKFSGSKSKLNYSTVLRFYEKEQQRVVTLDILKNFDLQELIKIGIKGNPFLLNKFPHMYGFISADESNPSFQAKKDVKAQDAFAQEFIHFTKTAFGLSTENAFEVMAEESILLKGMVDFKASLLSLIEYKDFDKVDFVKIGNSTFMRFSYIKQKPFDLIIPLIKGNGRVLRVSFDKREGVGNLSAKFYKYNLLKANWLADETKFVTEVPTTLQVLDKVSDPEFKKKLNLDLAQSLYAYYFETSMAVLKRNVPTELSLWIGIVKNFMQLLEQLPSPVVGEGAENPKQKLEQNFRDVLDALENKNFEFFGISQSTSV